jgi:glycosyltransferase involved in cell wall biosynthesis
MRPNAVKTVSVIVPACNYARYLSEAIDSALAQTYEPLEVIVVDDGSTDETAGVLAEYANRIRVIRQRNQGVSAARNSGISAARGEYIAFLDADDSWHPRKLELQMARFDADPALELVHCGAESFDAEGRRVQAWRDGMEGRVALNMLRFDGAIAAPGSNIVASRRVAEEIGGFDTRMTVSEDWDFCYRVAARYEIGFAGEALVRYRIHGSGAHRNIPAMEKGMLLALQKAFASPDPAVQSVRNLSYGRVHRMLAGCYFEIRQPSRFAWHVLQSLRYDARNLGYFAAYPLRFFSRYDSE